MWDTLANAQKLIGKKGLMVPEATSSAEDRKAFLRNAFDAYGRPQKPEEYQFKPIDGYNRPAEFESILRQTAFESNLPADIASEMFHRLESSLVAQHAAEMAQEQQLLAKMQADDKAFQDQMTKWYGAEYEKRLETIRPEIAKNVPEVVRDQIKDLDARSTAVLLATVDSLTKAYTGEGTFGKMISEGSTGAGQTKEALTLELEKIVSNPEMYNFRSPNYQQLHAAKNEIEKKLFRMR